MLFSMPYLPHFSWNFFVISL